MPTNSTTDGKDGAAAMAPNPADHAPDAGTRVSPPRLATANLGFPRIGVDRELKWATERYWRGDLDADGLEAVARELRARHWRLQADRGIDRIPVGDFSFYDQVLDAAVTLGAVPERFGAPFDLSGGAEAFERYFAMARGGPNVTPLELTKWFDTNYHYLVPELAPDQTFAYSSSAMRSQFEEAAAQGITTRPVVLGPITFLRLAKRTDDGPTIDLIGSLLGAYEAWLADLVAAGAGAIQIDEPVLALDLDDTERAAFGSTYERLRMAAGDAEITLATYFGDLRENVEIVADLPIDVVHLDLVAGGDQLAAVAGAVPRRLGLSLGLVDGRNIWRTDLATLSLRLAPVIEDLGADRIHVAPSCSLLHLPVDADREEGDGEVKPWLAFAVQRLDEVSLLASALAEDEDALHGLAASTAAVEARAASPLVHQRAVKDRLDTITPEDIGRASPYPERAPQQQARLGLRSLPTTTIGSFPQTSEIRQLRARYRKGEIDAAAYEAGLAAETESCVRRQEKLGLDVLVHGEFERTDMVEYFGQQLDGFTTTSHGWVQSFGSRCVKPPVLFGDIARPRPMTVDWSRFAAELTERPVKGMLTGPVTILAWSFVRDDQSESETARQVALALRDEVADLEEAGIGLVQIDEPALRESLPLRRADRAHYLDWATEAFRLVAGGASDHTQIHTHMCYAEFGEIMQAVIDLDADVISMEASRSGMELIEELRAAGYPNEVGPGVWDIHSPRVPEPEEVDRLLAQAIGALGPERLWVNPDCGLKTRDWPEVEASLTVLVAAAERARAASR